MPAGQGGGGKPLPELHLPLFGRIIGTALSRLPSGEHLRPHHLVLVKNICQFTGQLKPFQFAVLTSDIGLYLPETPLFRISQESLYSPGKDLPFIAVRGNLYSDFFRNEIEKLQGKHKPVIAETAKLISKSLAHHSLHALALDKKQFSGKQISLAVFPDYRSQMIEQILSPVGSMKIIDGI
jgi:hypothetical protein